MFFIPEYILILLVTILIDYYAGIWIERSPVHSKKLYLILSIISTCLVLIIFKYLEFFNQNIISLSTYFGFTYPNKALEIILPIGLSFHTFQSLSYVIEVYRGKQKAEKHFGIYSLYVMFYPQLVTGPIERPQNLLVQLREFKPFQYNNIISGLRLILFGLFIKMVVADNLGVYVDQIYTEPEKWNSLSISIGLTFYSFQIYCDFFGYSTIAVGAAKAMGYNLMDNFKNPYIAKSISEFWQRWHISLSTWFRDYVFFPMGGSKVKIPRWIINILIVFAISGFWHGANWTFVLWGLAHGILYIVEVMIGKKISPLTLESKTLQWIWNGLLSVKNFILVSLIWILFRSTDLNQVQRIVKNLFSNVSTGETLSVDPKIWIFLLIFLCIDYLLIKKRFEQWCGELHWTFRWGVYSMMIFFILVFSNVENFPFIYFQF
jgi:D-alanyl-lipoteichoic acid acyltransferase DltB (MBOAT superfamily)